ncbi:MULTISPECIES: dihydropteroate synthase [Muribaculaceae]|uniref:dihydropteroate synthase n=1 Tax=Muribaculum intestinale TaxID=1796646 RepID=A0A1B1S9I7_9BACT|nr:MULTISPECIES: dihydropteroate synthase [Muribaculaceae]ROT09507.1 dihydropteroate synthase [Muribaculaceae bacterium Isolate-100 (HZI)]RXE65320.1 dihydropteroate synthase [Muribaculaceae bacterium Isolate-007 (NCI)]ANU63462.1 dihydropteroate synthase [Muribaculum intestinale]ASB38458.1 dihydropteroate synthase [Muribaculum intestinale]PWB00512.1 dihydropteroate synthase [Muribaculum intestinale]
MHPFSLKLRGRVVEFDHPQIMGIVNVTPDSFYAGSRTGDSVSVARRVEKMIEDGADWIDIGAYSSRPGALEVTAEEEIRRLRLGMEALRKVDSDIFVSVDTFRAEVADIAVKELGADMINDISGGTLDSDMFAVVAETGVPYVLMHMRGTPSSMQTMTDYTDVTADVLADLQVKLSRLGAMGVADVVVDPGFGFAKTLEQNYTLMRDLGMFGLLDCPVLVGVSRKSMIYRLAGKTPDESLFGTVALNALALERGAAFLRVHDVAAAYDTRAVVEAALNNSFSQL